MGKSEQEHSSRHWLLPPLLTEHSPKLPVAHFNINECPTMGHNASLPFTGRRGTGSKIGRRPGREKKCEQ
jgi:hypothetical protein